MYSSNSHGVIDPDGHVITPSEVAQLLNDLTAAANDGASLADQLSGALLHTPERLRGGNDIETVLGVVHALVGVQAQNRILVQVLRKYLTALQTIQTLGHVCPDFQTCDHVACRDSHTAWTLAVKALQEEDGRPSAA